MSSTVDHLLALRALIAAGWTQNVGARAADGEPLAPDDPRAVSHCLLGAAAATAGRRNEAERERTRAALRAAYVALYPEDGATCSDALLMLFNDAEDVDQAAVLALVDRALVIASK